jgi:hypothetical protein
MERAPLSLVSTTEELLERKSSGSGLENRKYGRRDPSRRPRGTLYQQQLAITSPTCGGRPIGIVSSNVLFLLFILFPYPFLLYSSLLRAFPSRFSFFLCVPFIFYPLSFLRLLSLILTVSSVHSYFLFVFFPYLLLPLCCSFHHISLYLIHTFSFLPFCPLPRY